MIGSILFNGNIQHEEDFIYRFKDRILQSNHIDPSVRESKKALLITGAWGQEEYNESHVKDALRKIGIASKYKDGFDENIQNLAVYHEWQEFYKRHPHVKEIYEKSLDSLFLIKKFYQEKNAELIELLRKHTRMVKQQFRYISLADILSYSIQDEEWQIPQMDDRQLLKHYSCEEIQKTLSFLIGGDDLQTKISQEIQEYAKIKSGVVGNPAYQKRRKELIDRILSSNSIFIFGGYVSWLYYSLKFWDLEHALSEALMRGANFYTVSAGSIVLCQKIIVYNDFLKSEGERKRNFEFFDNGLGLVTKIKLFPHCRDRIHTDDPDNLAYLAHRFQGRVCVGLNEESFLLLDAHYGPNGRLYPRFTSLGEKDAVYVFDPSGQKVKVYKGDQIMVPGTQIWEERNKAQGGPDKRALYEGETLWSGKG